MNFKSINIGEIIKREVLSLKIEATRICNFMKCTEEEVDKMYAMKSMDCELLLRWSKLLEYDFFRLYSQHLILYAPVKKGDFTIAENPRVSSLPRFRKNIYTKEMIEFVLLKVEKREMSKQEIIERYNIPKTTLYKWISKYKKISK